MRNKICALPYCNIKFDISKTPGQLYCCPEHQLLHQADKMRATKAKVEKELAKFQWQKSHMGRLNKWYKVFGENQSCDLCGITFKEALYKYSVPLFMELQPDIRDWRVMEQDSWFRYCLKCYTSILCGRAEEKELSTEKNGTKH